MSDVVVRPAKDTDRAAIVELIRDQQAHLHGLFDRMKPPGDIGAWYLDALETRCAEEHGTLLVAEAGEALVGYAVVVCRVSSEREMDEVLYTHAHVPELSVLSGWRRRGIGRALLTACERIARDDGARWIRIASLAANTAARGAYEAAGFREHLIDYEKPLT